MICADCGQQLWEGVRFCPNCGVHVPPVAESAVDSVEAQASEHPLPVADPKREPEAPPAVSAEPSPLLDQAGQVGVTTYDRVAEAEDDSSAGGEGHSDDGEHSGQAGCSPVETREDPMAGREVPKEPEPEPPTPEASPAVAAGRSRRDKRRIQRVLALAAIGIFAVMVGVGMVAFNPFAREVEPERIGVGDTAAGTLEKGQRVVYEFEGEQDQVVSAYIAFDEGDPRFVDILDADGRALSETATARLPDDGTYHVDVESDAEESTYTLSLDAVTPEQLTVPGTVDVSIGAGEVKLYTIDMSTQAPLVATVVQGDGFAGETSIVDLDTRRGQPPLATISGSRSRLVAQKTGTVGIELASTAASDFSLSVEPVPPDVLVPGAWTTVKVEGASALVGLFVPTPQDVEIVAMGKKGFDPTLTLHDPAGQVVAQSDGSSRGTDTTLRASAATRGIYRIEVGSVDGKTGSVDINIE